MNTAHHQAESAHIIERLCYIIDTGDAKRRTIAASCLIALLSGEN